jgi:hypothetical protein
MKRSSRRASLGASAAWATGQSAPGDRARSSRAFFSARVWAISPTAWHGCGRLVSRAPLQLNSRSVGRRLQSTSIRQPADLAVPTINGNILHWVLALEFSTLYLTNRFTGGPPKEEPLNQFAPLVEFAFDTPIGRGFGHKTAGTSNPGLSYVAETWQLAAEAILPMKSRSRPWCGRQNPAAPRPRRFGADAVRKADVESIGLRSNQAHVPEALRLHQFLPGKRCRGGC